VNEAHRYQTTQNNKGKHIKPRIDPELEGATKLVDLVNLYAELKSSKTVATNEAKTHLSALLQEVANGKTIVITRGCKRLAKLVPYDEAGPDQGGGNDRSALPHS
jgi:prevent-host-death family protein